MRLPGIQCLTADGFALSHVEQARALCAAGAGWIQLRMKHAEAGAVADAVRECLPVCREAGSVLIVNDHLEAALKSGADGVHLGKNDLPWEEARARAGSDFIIGGTVNSLEDAKRASASGVLDYAGVGPFRFTQTKEHLAEILKLEDWQAILQELGDLPGYAIGGIGPEDLNALAGLGASGVAVCSCLIDDNPDGIVTNYKSLALAWEEAREGRICQS